MTVQWCPSVQYVIFQTLPLDVISQQQSSDLNFELDWVLGTTTTKTIHSNSLFSPFANLLSRFRLNAMSYRSKNFTRLVTSRDRILEFVGT